MCGSLTLLHHVTYSALLGSFLELKKQVAPGVDRVTWEQYQEGLEKRLAALYQRVHNGTYKAQPSRRVYIPKPDRRQRPIGIAAIENKIVQHAVGEIFTSRITRKKMHWVLDDDIQGFFDTISHEWMLRFISGLP